MNDLSSSSLSSSSLNSNLSNDDDNLKNINKID